MKLFAQIPLQFFSKINSMVVFVALGRGGGASLVVQRLGLHAPKIGGLGLIPDQGTPSCMLQLRVNMLQLRLGTAKINK